MHQPAFPARPPCLPCQPRGHPCQNAPFRNPSRRRPLNAAGELRLRAHQPQAAWPAIEHCLWPSFRMSCAPVFRLTSNITSAIFVLFNLELVVEQTCRRYNSRVIRLSAILISILHCTLALNSLLSIKKWRFCFNGTAALAGCCWHRPLGKNIGGAEEQKCAGILTPFLTAPVDISGRHPCQDASAFLAR